MYLDWHCSVYFQTIISVQISQTQDVLPATNNYKMIKRKRYWAPERGQHPPGLKHLKPVQRTLVCAVYSQHPTGGTKTQTYTSTFWPLNIFNPMLMLLLRVEDNKTVEIFLSLLRRWQMPVVGILSCTHLCLRCEQTWRHFCGFV